MNLQVSLGLNKNLDEVRGLILATRPLPNIREVAAEVRCEESRKKVMLGTGNQLNTDDASALVSGKPMIVASKRGNHGASIEEIRSH